MKHAERNQLVHLRGNTEIPRCLVSGKRVEHVTSDQELVTCPKCMAVVEYGRQLFSEAGRRGGLVSSPAKAKAARKNGKKGGRPPKPMAVEQ